MTHWVKLWEKPENLTHFALTDPVEAVRPLAEKLRSQVDVLIGVYHGGLEKDLHTGALLSETDENEGCRLCEQFPFDLLLTGHQHIALANETYAGTHVVQTPCNAAAYVKVEMDEQGLLSFPADDAARPGGADAGTGKALAGHEPVAGSAHWPP